MEQVKNRGELDETSGKSVTRVSELIAVTLPCLHPELAPLIAVRQSTCDLRKLRIFMQVSAVRGCLSLMVQTADESSDESPVPDESPRGNGGLASSCTAFSYGLKLFHR